MTEAREKRYAMNIALLMPAYNPGSYLEAALNSAVAQLTVVDRIIVQDAGSSDGSREVYARADERVQVAIEADGGQADALNKALARTDADWVGWLNADDVLYEASLARIREAILRNPDANVIVGGWATIDDRGSEIQRRKAHQPTVHSLLRGLSMPFSGSLFIRADHLRRIGAFRAQFHYCMDYDLYVRLWDDVETRTVTVDGVLGALRIVPGTKTSEHPWRFVKEAMRIRKAHASGIWRGLEAVLGVFIHSVLVASTRVRGSDIYRQARTRLLSVRGYVER